MRNLCKTRRRVNLFILAVALLLLSCRFAVAAGAKSSAYVVYEDGSIWQYSLTSGGVLQPLDPAVVRVGKSSTRLVIGPSGQYAYIADAGGRMHAFRIGANGSLSAVDTISLSGGKTPCDIAIDPSGRHMYVSFSAVSEEGGSEVHHFIISPEGIPQPATPLSAKAGSATNTLAVHPSAAFVYAGSTWDGTISGYSVNRDGALSPLDPPIALKGGWVGDIAISHDGSFFYITDSQWHRVLQFRIEPDGQLSMVSIGRFGDGIGGQGHGPEIDLDASGNALTVADPAGSSVYRFLLADGKLAASPQYCYHVTRDNRLLTRQELDALADNFPEVKAALANKTIGKIDLHNARARSKSALSTTPSSITAAPDGSLYLFSAAGVLRLGVARDGQLKALGSVVRWKDKWDIVDENRVAGKDNVFEGVALPVRHGITILWR